MKKYGFIYIWRDKKHKRYYVGCRWGTENDGYVCSSTWMNQAYKHRPQDFKRRIIKTNIQNRTQLLDEEYKWLQLIKLDELKTKYYNLHNHHFGHWTLNSNTLSTREKIKVARAKQVFTEETRQKMSEKLKQRWAENEEYRNKMIENSKGENNPFYGKTHSEESRQKLSKANKGRHIGEKHPMFGTHMSEEHKEKLKQINKGNKYSVGRVASEETKEKMKQATLKQFENPERRENCRQHFKKFWSDPEHRQYMSELYKGQLSPMKGKTHSEESKKKMSEVKKGKILSKEHKNKIRESLKTTLAKKRLNCPSH